MMDSAMTQFATIGIFVLGIALLLTAGIAFAVLVRKARGKKSGETFEPRAGKTLGL
jgi:hypothetical protein